MTCLVLGVTGFLNPAALAAQGGAKVIVIEAHETIDRGLAPYIKRILKSAHDDETHTVILEIDTPGGRLDSALEIKNAILGSTVPVVAFVNREAFSAGALIAIAAHKIYMTPGGALGAATPMEQSGIKADEKIVSAVRAAFRSTAEYRDRNPDIAEAMVDDSVVLEGIVEKGKLLTLTSGDALKLGFVDGEVEDLEELLEVLGLSDATVDRTSPSWAELVARFVTNPMLASLLISLGFLGLLSELMSPGFGLSGLGGIILLGVFFWGHLLAGLAGWETVALVGLGLVLIGVEVFLVPGFGFAGITGIALSTVGLFFTLVGPEPGAADFQRAVLTLIGSLTLTVVSGFVILRYVSRGRLFGSLVLRGSLPAGPGTKVGSRFSWNPMPQDNSSVAIGPTRGSLVGTRGQTQTDLHPSGIALIDNQRLSVISEGGFIASGTTVEVIADEGYRRIVRPIESP